MRKVTEIQFFAEIPKFFPISQKCNFGIYDFGDAEKYPETGNRKVGMAEDFEQ